MSEISVYDIVPTPKLADKLIGTSVGGVIPDVTYNFTLEELLQLFIPNIPANNLQGVLDYGNTATQDINLTGTINTTDLNVFATASILDSILSGETHITGELYDGLDSKGTAGQVLTSTGSGVEWYTIPTIIPTLQQVLTSGNTADKNIILTANITAVTATATNVVSNSSLSVNGSLKDGTASTGSTDQLLSSTGSGVRWVDMPVYNAVSPLLYNNTTKTFSIQVANSSQGGYLSNADWINFDGKQDAIVLTTAGTSGAATFVGNTLNIPVYSPDLSGYVPVSRTLTINGVTYDLSANRSWTVDAGVAEVTATAPLSSSGGAYPDISISQSNSSTDGYLSSADWLAFNSKQDALGGTGLVKSTSGTITYITDNSGNWNTAYNESIISAAVTGTSTKTLTLNQQDGGTIQASWSDADTGLTSVGLSMPSAFTVANSPLTSNGTIGVTGAGTTAQYVRGDGSLATFPTIAPEAATLVTEVYNETGATLTKGTVVYINGGHGNLPTVAKALATGDATSAQTYGVVQVDITNMNNGHVVVIGSLGDLDTQAYANGTQLYLSSTTAGAWTSVKQYAPAHLVYVGVVVRSHPTQGVVEIKIQNGYEMDELHNVYAQNPNNNAILQYKTATSLWTSVDGSTTNIAEGTNLYYLDSRARAAISLTTTGSSGAATYNSTTGVFNIPNYGSALTAYVPYTGATANVNLGTYNLTADSLIKSGGTSSQFLKADGSVDSSAYITLTSLSAAAPLSYDNSIGAFSISQAGASADGYLSSTDWNTFNNKQVAGNYITSLTGEATGTGPGATAVTLNNASVTGKLLTGVNITGGSVVATDTMLTAFGKLQNQINGLIGSTIYQGTWNANTNTPALASSVGTRGYYYIVNVAGNTNLNGITDWQVGDWAIYDGSAWQKVDNTDSVTSVNGFTGAVSLTTDNITQGTTNLYFANSLARSAVSLTTTGSSGAATYNNTTGVFNIPNYGTALANYLPLTGGTLTGALLINPSDTAVVGLNIASDTVILRSDSTQPFRRQLTTTMGSGTLIKMQASGSGAVYVTDLGFYTSSSSAVNTTPNLYLTGGNNRVGINTDTPANTLDVVGTAGVSGVLTLGSTISNGTYSYTLPGATGTLALVGGAGVGTVTSVAALTIGTTGTDLSSSVANSTTTPVITLNVPTASATNRGALSAADWTTFNSKQSALTFSSPLVNTSGTISIPAATATENGYLTSTDWTTFNSKQNALTNPITGSLTTNKVPKATGATTLGDSIITANSTNISVSAASVDDYVGKFTNTDAGSHGLFVKADEFVLVSETLAGVNNIYLYGSGNATFNGDITANKYIKIGGTSSQFLMADGSVSTGPAGGITGSLTIGYIPKATSSSAIGNSAIFQDGTNIGIGTVTPGKKLDVSASDANVLRLQRTGLSARQWDINITPNFTIGDNTAAADRLVIDTSGYVGINTLTPATILHVNGGATMTGGWNKTATLQAQYPTLIFNSNATKWGAIGYDYSNAMSFWVNATSDNVNGTGLNAFQIYNTGSADFNYSLTVANALNVGKVGDVIYTKSNGTAYSRFLYSGAHINVVFTGGTTANSGAFGINNYEDSVRLFNILNTGAATFSNTLRSGNVGINTAALAGTALRVVQNTDDNWTAGFSNNNVSAYGVYIDHSAATSSSIAAFQVYTPSGTGLKMQNNGRLLLGTFTDAGYTFDVSGSGRFKSPGLSSFGFDIANTSGTRGAGFYTTGGNNVQLYFYNSAGVEKIVLDGGSGNAEFVGNITVGRSSSYGYIYGPSNQIFGSIGGNTTWINSGTSGLRFNNAADNQTRMFMSDAGNFGIGTTSPSTKLYVSGTSTFSDEGYFLDKLGVGTTSLTYRLEASGASGSYWNGSAFTGTPLAIAISNTIVGGYDPVLLYRQADSGGTVKLSGGIGLVGTAAWTAGNNASQISDMYFLVRNSSGSISERMRITSAGNVGIGTTSPVDYTNYRSLHISGATSTSSAILYLTNSTSTLRGLFFAEGSANRVTIGSQSSHDFTFLTADTTRMTILAGGPINLGSTSDYLQTFNDGGGLYIEGTASTDAKRKIRIQQGNSSFSQYSSIFIDGANQAVGITTGNTTRLYVTQAGYVGIGTSSPQAPIHAIGGTTMTGGWNRTAMIAATYPVMVFNSNGTRWAGLGYDYSGSGAFILWVNATSENVSGTGVQAFNIANNRDAAFYGSVTATSFFESSDKTIKTLIKDNYQVKGIESVVAKLYTKNGKEELGYYAQDVQGILPSAVSKGTDGLLTLSYREVHTAKIARLEKRVAELEQLLNLN